MKVRITVLLMVLLVQSVNSGAAAVESVWCATVGCSVGCCVSLKVG